jgi:predicted secreted protein
MAMLGRGIVLMKGAQKIAEIDSCGTPQWTADDIEVTHTESPDGYKEYVQGLKDGGEVSLGVNWLPGETSQKALYTAFEAGTVEEYSIPLNDTPKTTITFDAYVKGISPAIDRSGKVTATITFRVTGKPTITTAAS